MPPYASILASNALLSPSPTNNPTARIAVFAGATSGIGKHTVRALVATGARSRIYIIGRPSAAETMGPFFAEMHALNERAILVWTEGEISLLAEVRRICDEIKAKEPVIDLLFLTAGYAPFGGRKETPEGLEIASALEYYGRILFATLLLPALKKASAGRVISVLGGGLEGATTIRDVEDLQMKKPGAWSGVGAQGQYVVMNTLGLERLAEGEGEGVTFVHAWPGLVSTGNIRRGHGEGSVAGWLAWAVEPVLGVLGTSGEVCGQRYLFEGTSGMYGGRGTVWEGVEGVNSRGEVGDGLFLVNYKGDCTPNGKVLGKLREGGVQDRVWEHTREVLKPYM
ncbi:hypothetical protein QBC39DRAFT_302288 [Podospora conica]|nr:hypothetical protein QBC39DRAFT_302288 [Schizothecium conicum]